MCDYVFSLTLYIILYLGKTVGWCLQEVALHSAELQRLQDSNKSLRQEIKQLSSDHRIDVRQAMFPELFNLSADGFAHGFTDFCAF